MAFVGYKDAIVSHLRRGVLYEPFFWECGLAVGFRTGSIKCGRWGGAKFSTSVYRMSSSTCPSFFTSNIPYGQSKKLVAEPCGSVVASYGSFSWKPETKLSATLAAGAPINHLESLSDTQREQISIYIDELMDWNKRMNLTAIKERSAIMERHIEDSLSLLPVIERTLASSNSIDGGKDKAGALRLVDVGTGAGLPGVILAIARPDWDVTLLEASRKRCEFLSHVLRVAAVTGPRVIWMRAEDAGRDPTLRESHDVAVARAVAEMRVLAELCLPLVRVGGGFVAAKGPAPEDEVARAAPAVEELGAQLLGISSGTSEGPNGARKAVVYVKVAETPDKYPRRAGIPSKRPL